MKLSNYTCIIWALSFCISNNLLWSVRIISKIKNTETVRRVNSKEPQNYKAFRCLTTERLLLCFNLYSTCPGDPHKLSKWCFSLKCCKLGILSPSFRAYLKKPVQQLRLSLVQKKVASNEQAICWTHTLLWKKAYLEQFYFKRPPPIIYQLVQCRPTNCYTGCIRCTLGTFFLLFIYQCWNWLHNKS